MRGPGKEVGNVRGLQAGIATEETAAAAVTGIMTAEEVMIATMTGKERENLGDLVVMIRGATAGLVHVPQEEVLGIMIDMGVMDVEIGTRCKETLLTFSSLPCTRCSRWTILRGGLR